MESGAMRTFILALAAVAFAAPAIAQAAGPFEKAATKLSESCLALKANAESAAVTIPVCEKTLRDLSELRASYPPLSMHERNVDAVIISMAETRIGNAYAFQDNNVRTARVCARMERSWAALAKADPAASPSYTALLKSLIGSTVAVIGKCRAQVGVPPDAPPLPG
jgi:hypothetical protein